MIGDSGAVRSGRIDFERVNRSALARSVAVVRGLLPEGRLEGHEYVARNPLRPDRRLGSFKVNVTNGRWADFATGDGGGDLVSLVVWSRHLMVHYPCRNGRMRYGTDSTRKRPHD